MSSIPTPQRGEFWETDLDPAFGHEQGGRRLLNRWGTVSVATLVAVEDQLRDFE